MPSVPAAPVRPLAEAPRASGALAGQPGTPSPQQSFRSRWTPVSWNDLPGWQEDSLHDAWNAWLQNCERPGPLVGLLCPDVRQLVLASDDDRRLWMMAHLQPYRVEALDGTADGLLTSYFEPQLDASRVPTATFNVPIYQPPRKLALRKPWFKTIAGKEGVGTQDLYAWGDLRKHGYRAAIDCRVLVGHFDAQNDICW